MGIMRVETDETGTPKNSHKLYDVAVTNNDIVWTLTVLGVHDEDTGERWMRWIHELDLGATSTAAAKNWGITENDIIVF